MSSALPQAQPLADRDLAARPFLMFLWKEVRRFWKVKSQTLFSPLIQSTLYLYGIPNTRINYDGFA